MDQQFPVPGVRPDQTPQALTETAPESRVDASEADRAAERYASAIEPLLAEAMRSNQVRSLVGVLACQVARLVDRYGQPAAGDFLQQLGEYLYRYSRIRLAEQELAAEKKQGRQPS